MMLFLFSERLFTRDCFTDFAMTMSWDTERFNRMLKDEWIIIWRKRTGMESNTSYLLKGSALFDLCTRNLMARSACLITTRTTLCSQKMRRIPTNDIDALLRR
jgi:hypothetical protein